ncbi:hypothetical protein WKI71_35200 [Streptomyces sp. MS1.AVA.1]|uniref:Uncharacterized protein n=1 Tax=Streptomyces machairae TaxID=3134109 RepID=A0ABU8US31_9ACTN
MTRESQLRVVEKKEATDTAVRDALTAVFPHMHGGRSRNRRGGRRLTELLEAARGAAADAGEWQVVRLLQDSLDYAEAGTCATTSRSVTGHSRTARAMRRTGTSWRARCGRRTSGWWARARSC